MPASASLVAGITLLWLAAALPRAVAGTRWRGSAVLALDLAMPLLVFGLVFALGGRPLFAGVVTLALGAGFAYADRAKRQTLQEPIVFTDVFQAVDIFRHPQLALPFPHIGRVLLGAGSVVAAFVALYLLEPRRWPGSLLLLPLIALMLALLRGLVSGPARAATLRRLQALGASADPAVDAARFGPLATLWIHALMASGERAQRRRGARPTSAAGDGVDGPLVLVQSESFFDARRLHPQIDRGLLPNFDRCSRDSQQHGRLTVPSWGANTVRTEFAVLSGLAPAALGFDHFNPYFRFADAPVDTLAWRLRARGYRTICLHPFDGRFYGRDRIMAQLGFDELIDESGFAADAPRVEGYISDTEVARVARDLLLQHGPRLFLFIITMENHGPWKHDATQDDPHGSRLPGLAAAEGQALGRYLQSLRNTDTLLGVLRDSIETDFDAGSIAFYGDHLPSFPGVFRKLGLDDRRSDYLIWRRGGGRAAAVDVSAQDLGAALLQPLA